MSWICQFPIQKQIRVGNLRLDLDDLSMSKFETIHFLT